MIYLDYNATGPILPEVQEAMKPWLNAQWGNPSSVYAYGRIAKRAVEEARQKLAVFVGANPEQILFTSGATEANNAAIHSALLQQPRKRHIVTSMVEHSAVLAYCDHLERYWKVEVTRLPVDPSGLISLDDLRKSIRPDTAIVSLMWANNETGVIWPVEEFSEICATKNTPLHTDAVQAVGKVHVNFRDSGASYLSLSGHKFGAPKGIGALVIKEPYDFVPFNHGGKQEDGRRGGTENVSFLVGLGEACALVTRRGFEAWNDVSTLRDQLEYSLLRIVEGSQINGSGQNRLPNTTNIYLPEIDGDTLVTYLDQQGICISSGSACLESAITPSHVIFSMTQSHNRASESVRISLGVETTKADVQKLLVAIETFVGICNQFG